MAIRFMRLTKSAEILCRRCTMQRLPSFLGASSRLRSTTNAFRLGFFLLLLLTTSLLCSGTNPAPTTPTTPTLTVTPAYAPPGTDIYLWGSGFDPLSNVDIYFDAIHLTTITTNSSGAFGGGSIQGGVAVQLPASATPGQHWISAFERSGQKLARKFFLVRTDWAEFHFDAGHSGLNPYENVLGPANVGGLQLDWSYQTGGPVGLPAVANGVLYVGSEDTNLYALNASTGALLWTYATGVAFTSSPGVANGVAYVGCSNGLCALNATTGALLWTFSGGGTPTVANGVVYIDSPNGESALNAATGALLWQYPLGAPTVAVGENQVVFGSRDPITLQCMVYGLNAATGSLAWSTFVGNSQEGCGFSEPAFSTPYVYLNVMTSLAQQEYGNLFCLGMMRGGIGWEGQAGGVGLDPAVGNGMVYNPTEAVQHRPAWLSAYTMDTGVLVWQYTGVTGSPVVANGVVYFGDGSLYALSASTGALLWQSPAMNLGIPVVVNGVAYAGSSDGHIYAFNLSGSH